MGERSCSCHDAIATGCVPVLILGSTFGLVWQDRVLGTSTGARPAPPGADFNGRVGAQFGWSQSSLHSYVSILPRLFSFCASFDGRHHILPLFSFSLFGGRGFPYGLIHPSLILLPLLATEPGVQVWWWLLRRQMRGMLRYVSRWYWDA